MNWWQVSMILSAYGVFKEFRPSEPFIVQYLTNYKNFTIEEVYTEIFPLGTYFYLLLLIAIFLLTDFLRYKPVLFAGGIAGVATWSLLIWGTTIKEMQIVEFNYGFFLASEVAYYSYIYAKVDKVHYQKVTSHTRAGYLLGRAGAGLSSQLFFHYNVLDVLQLNYLTVFGVGTATLLVIFLPSVPQSIYFHRKSNEQMVSNGDEGGCDKSKESKSSVRKYRAAFSALYYDFKQAFKNLHVLQWSIWWALGTCGYLQVTSYCQLLWEDVVQNCNVSLYHGFVELGASLSGAAVAFGVGYMKIPWNIWGEISLGVLAIAQGGFLLYCSFSNDLYIIYVMHILYQAFYQSAITVATYEIARQIKEDSHALIFGINTFIALIIQAILTAVVIDMLGSNIRKQFEIYSGYHFFIGCGFLVSGIFTIFNFRKKKSFSPIITGNILTESSMNLRIN